LGTVDILWTAAPVSLIVLLIVLRRWWHGIIRSIGKTAQWLFGFVGDARTCEVAKTCCGEAAVLLLVFPTLDTLYDHRKLSDPLLHQSIEAAAIFFLFAVILAHAEKPGKGG
jgi:hypothetical protein